ncbi:prephenate dehydrogenase [Actinoplanes sp. NPDC051346]|uniref:prephenate dehydrogenase n=1 Tax=Actinoplanes sp. NPDC051346 TaxID=3155048 RepID=UPI0034160A09
MSDPRPARPASLAVVGAGLIGASIALAARAAGLTVTLADRDPAAVAEAVARGAGRPARPDDPPADLAVLAVPPDAVPGTLLGAQQRRLARAYTDVASVKAPVVAEIRAAGGDLALFVPGHPMSGRESSGAATADPDLFAGRAWALCPGPETDPAAAQAVLGLVALCRAVPVLLDVAEHDRAVAVVSHVPHLVSSAMAAALGRAAEDDLRLAGPGVSDVTRVAAGHPELWTQILRHNAPQIATVLDRIAEDLRRTATALAADPPDLATVTELLTQGRTGRSKLERAVAHRADRPLRRTG